MKEGGEKNGERIRLIAGEYVVVEGFLRGIKEAFGKIEMREEVGEGGRVREGKEIELIRLLLFVGRVPRSQHRMSSEVVEVVGEVTQRGRKLSVLEEEVGGGGGVVEKEKVIEQGVNHREDLCVVGGSGLGRMGEERREILDG